MSLVKPNRPALVDLGALAAMVEPGDRIATGGHHFARLPIALLREVAARRPEGLRYFAWAGGLPLELLLEAGCVASIDLCFSSLDIFGLAPRFRNAAESGEIPVTDWPALALIQSMRAREQNLPFLPMQPPVGSTLAETCPALTPYTDPRTGREVALVAPTEIDVALLHCPRADAAGNVEIVGAQALDKIVVGASRKVLVTVDEIVPAGALGRGNRSLVLPRNRISAIAHVAFGAAPCSSLPFYATDFARVRAIIEDRQTPLLEALAPREPPAHIRLSARVPAAAIRPAAFDPAVPADAPPTTDEIMAVRIARTLDDDCHASAGAVSPLANVAYRLAKATHAPGLLITTLSGGQIDVAAGTMSLTLAEAMDAATASALCGGEDSYWFYYQGGWVTHEIVGTAQIDARARTNTIRLTKSSGEPLRLPGQGGMADVANMHRDFIVYVPRHTPAAFVESVEVASAARGLISAQEREAAGYRAGEIRVFTDLCAFRYDEGRGRLVVTELMPEVTREEVRAATGFDPVFDDDLAVTDLPSPHELRVLREVVDPLGLRRLEFAPARDRAAILDDILARDRAAVERIVTGSHRGETP